MKAGDLGELALRNLREAVLRNSLTTLGVAVGVASLIFTHVFQNIGMTIGILPITGVPLPLISYSGSFVVVIMFGLGLVNSVWVHRKMLP